MRVMATVLAMAGLLAFVACGETGPEDLSQVPCREFRSLFDEYGRGVLNSQELHERVRSVYEGSRAATPALQNAAEELLRAENADDVPGFLAALSGMSDACKAAGW